LLGKLISKDEVRRIAANLAKLPERTGNAGFQSSHQTDNESIAQARSPSSRFFEQGVRFRNHEFACEKPKDHCLASNNTTSGALVRFGPF
jgi:isopropylmalate/homocitrate/citramalate synthase